MCNQELPNLDEIFEEVQIHSPKSNIGSSIQQSSGQCNEENINTPPLNNLESPYVCFSKEAPVTDPAKSAEFLTSGLFFQVYLNPLVQSQKFNDAFWDEEEHPCSQYEDPQCEKTKNRGDSVSDDGV